MSYFPPLTFSILLALALPVALVAGAGSVQAPVQDVSQQRLLLSGQFGCGRGQEAAPVLLHAVLTPPDQQKHFKKQCIPIITIFPPPTFYKTSS